MKRLLLTMAVMAAVVAAMAIPAKRGQQRTLTLTDGSQVVAELRGDEHGHYFEAADGRIFVETATVGVFESADIAHVTAKANQRREARNARRSQRHKEFGVPTSYRGSKKGIIILVNFTNKTFNNANNQAYFNNIVNTEGFTDSRFNGSVHDYFTAQSNGVFDLTFDVVGPVTVAHNYEYYGQNSGDDDLRPEDMIVEACHLVANQVDFSDYDWDGDGEVDQVFVVYAGKGEADGGESNTIWPHEWELSEVNKDFTLDGVRINTYACGPELNGSGQINGLGTICHEFTHCLGLPDFYDTSGGYSSNFGMDNWSLMDYGCYNNNGYTPCNYTGYERMFCGWVEPIELREDTQVTGMKSLSDYGDVYIMYNPAHKDEYYIFQNVQQKGWDRYAEGSGLLIMHVDYDKETWQADVVNNTSSRQRCTIFPADNSASHYSLSGDPFPNGSKNSFSNTTSPSARLYNYNNDGTRLMNIEVTGITEKSDGTVEFNFKNNNEYSDEPEPEGDILFRETFDKCAGNGGNDNRWSGSIASSGFIPDNEGWAVEKAYGGNQCARFGTSQKQGTATTPAFSVNGATTVTFKAAPWNAEGGSLLLSAEGDGFSLSQETFTLTNEEWTLCTVNLTGTGEVSLTFQSTKNRFFLDNIFAVKDESTGISVVTPQREGGSRRIFSLDGRYLGTDFDSLARGIYIIGGRKVIK